MDGQAALASQPVPRAPGCVWKSSHVTSLSPFINAYKHFCAEVFMIALVAKTQMEPEDTQGLTICLTRRLRGPAVVVHHCFMSPIPTVMLHATHTHTEDR